jgi:phospholipase/lecithinase/hemolysin
MAQLARAALAALGAGILVAACGGGTSQVEPFEPDQLVVFGDESSLVQADGRRYTVNPRNSTSGAIDCALQPIWTQAVAARLGFVFTGCNPADATGTPAQMRAAAGALADDVKAQIDQQLAAGGFSGNGLATVLAGGNDILALYAEFPRRSEEELLAEAGERGERLARQINRLVELGPRVLVTTVPDLGYSPYARAQQAAFTDTDRAALISRLVAAFNGSVRTTILNDGRYIGLVLGDEAVQAIARLPEAFGVKNVTSAACTVALPGCTDQTLAESASSAAWLWADDRHLAYAGHVQLGNLAVARATGNPF